MFDWFRAKAECPVDPATRRWIDGRWGWLVEQFGVERLRESPVVLPRPEFFPDRYDGTEEDARRMLDWVCGYMDTANAVIREHHWDAGPVSGWSINRRGYLGMPE